MSGESQEGLYEKYKKFYNEAINHINLPGVTVVKTKEQAKHCVKVLQQFGTRSDKQPTLTKAGPGCAALLENMLLLRGPFPTLS